MTLHSAKGLEYEVVFLVGMEEGIFPGYRSIENQKDIEEERRLCYVGITRAKQHLYLICAKQRTIFGSTQCNRISRFIQEIPKQYLQGSENIKEYFAGKNQENEKDKNTISEYEKTTFNPIKKEYSNQFSNSSNNIK
jgi:DNA helicase-2/ATP-dependent DNA helicase PcrA